MTVVNEDPLTEKSRYDKFKDWINDLLNSDEKGLTDEELVILNDLKAAETSVEQVRKEIDQSISESQTIDKLIDLFNINIHPSYFGFPFGKSTFPDFRGNSSTTRTRIINYELKSGNVAILRKVAIPYFATDFGTIKLEVVIGSGNILGDNGIIEQYHWFENVGIVTEGNIEVFAEEQNTAQAFSCVLSMLIISESVYQKIVKKFEKL